MTDRLTIRQGDALAVLQTLPDESVQMCVTSPPYLGLRDYGVAGQMGSEATPQEFVEKLVAVFTEVRRVLKKDGTCWVNLGDSYACTPPGCKGVSKSSGLNGAHGDTKYRKTLEKSVGTKRSTIAPGLKPKDLVGIPWMVAFALRADGWYLRSDIIWHKPNPMPESVTDRPSTCHEHLFLLSKNLRYYYDAEAILEPVTGGTHSRVSQNVALQVGSHRANGGGKTNGPMKAVVRRGKEAAPDPQSRSGSTMREALALPVFERNKRSVWTVPTMGYKGAHFATYPPDLIKPCILAGCPSRTCAKCDEVLDMWYVQDKYRTKVRIVQGSDGCPRQEGEGQEVLLETMCEQTHVEEPSQQQGLVQNDEGVHRHLPADASKCVQDGLRNGAQVGYGAISGAAAIEDGDRASQGREQGEQPSGKPRRDGKAKARCSSKDANRKDYLPLLLDTDGNLTTCPNCRADLSEIGAVQPGTVLDCFGGSGTTGAVALELGRKAILIELNPEYCKLIERRCDITPGLAL